MQCITKDFLVFFMQGLMPSFKRDKGNLIINAGCEIAALLYSIVAELNFVAIHS